MSKTAGTDTSGADDAAVPSWAQEPLDGFTDYVFQERNLVLLSAYGIGQTLADVPLVRALEQLKRFDLGTGQLAQEAQESTGVADAEFFAELARTEIDSDFRLLHGHSLVGIWGSLETMANDLVLAWLLNEPTSRQAPEISAIKVSLADFDAMTTEERMQMIVSTLDRDSRSSAGINRFERLLEPIFLSGSYNSQMASNLYEMQQIRNVFAHRRGIADRRFVAACPQVGAQIGQPVPLGQAAWSGYLVTAFAYAATLQNRILEHFGLPANTLEPISPIDHAAGAESSNLD